MRPALSMSPPPIPWRPPKPKPPPCRRQCRPAAQRPSRSECLIPNIGFFLSELRYIFRYNYHRCSARYIEWYLCAPIELAIVVYTSTNIRLRHDKERAAFESFGLGGAGAAVRAADASVRDGSHAEGAAQGSEHQ